MAYFVELAEGNEPYDVENMQREHYVFTYIFIHILCDNNTAKYSCLYSRNSTTQEITKQKTVIRNRRVKKQQTVLPCACFHKR